MQKDDQVYLGHMLDTARKIASKAKGITRDHYDANEDLQMVFAHLVQVLGEAASRVSQAGREQFSDIPWRRIVGMRHRIVHDYMNVDLEVLWEVVHRNIPELVAMLDKIVPPEMA
jgi:uncharacterized protein with HEPN domain